MRGLLADVHVQGHLPYLRRLFEQLGLWPCLADSNVELLTFHDLHLDPALDDRTLWQRCQESGLILFTANRNHDGADSLQATLTDAWRQGCHPVVTLANRARFEHSPEYARRVAAEVAEIMFGVAQGDYLDQPRIFVPRAAT